MKLKTYLIFGCLLLSGCAGALGDITSPNHIEKGLSYVACAIVTHGVLQAIFNK